METATTSTTTTAFPQDEKQSPIIIIHRFLDQSDRTAPSSLRQQQRLRSMVVEDIDDDKNHIHPAANGRNDDGEKDHDYQHDDQDKEGDDEEEEILSLPASTNSDTFALCLVILLGCI